MPKDARTPQANGSHRRVPRKRISYVRNQTWSYSNKLSTKIKELGEVEKQISDMPDQPYNTGLKKVLSMKKAEIETAIDDLNSRIDKGVQKHQSYLQTNKDITGERSGISNNS